MLEQQRHPGESLTARLAPVLLDLRMCLQMRPEIGPVRKRPGAMLARERLLPSVGPDVSLEQPGPAEGLPAQLTLAGQGVGANVHLQGSQRHVHLVAVLAAERLLRLLGRAVHQPVLGQAAVGRVGLAAIRALVPGGHGSRGCRCESAAVVAVLRAGTR